MRRLLAGLLLGGLLVACQAFPSPVDEDPWPVPAHGMVVSEHPLATRAGLEVLELGGNAADAAVATALALAVVYPQAGNLGGGGFALWVPHASGEASCLDFRETAPAELTADLFHDRTGAFVPERSLDGPLGVGVPGSPAGLLEFHKRHGRLALATVLRPALRLAQDGFPVDAWLARDLASGGGRARLERDVDSAALFYPGGQPLAEGTLLRQPALAKTLERLKDGRRGFYDGPVARALVEKVRAAGGVLSRDDLEGYEPKWRQPLVGWFRGFEVLTVPPPSSGGIVLLQALAVLDGFPLDEERQRTLDALAMMHASDPGFDVSREPGISSRAVHWWIEALRRGFADRQEHMEDPDFGEVPTERLLSPSWIAQRRVSIGELATPDVEPLPVEPRTDGETTHLSVLDGEGNAVSLTTTLNTSFGTGILVGEAGFLLNNEIDDFAIAEGAPNAYGLVGGRTNRIQPGKRPLSSMTPTVLRDGGQAVRLVVGSPGGPRIISAVLQTILRTEVYEEPLLEAVAAPRLHQQWKPADTFFEVGWDPLILEGLRSRGHGLRIDQPPFASVQAIRVELGKAPVGASDPRRGGAVGRPERGLVGPLRVPVDAP